MCLIVIGIVIREVTILMKGSSVWIVSIAAVGVLDHLLVGSWSRGAIGLRTATFARTDIEGIS